MTCYQLKQVNLGEDIKNMHMRDWIQSNERSVHVAVRKEMFSVIKFAFS